MPAHWKPTLLFIGLLGCATPPSPPVVPVTPSAPTSPPPETRLEVPAASPQSASPTEDPSLLRDLGRTRTAAIEVCNLPGVARYLKCLVCPATGATPVSARAGTVGPRSRQDGHLVDRYILFCGDKEVDVFFDLHHCERAVPQGEPAGVAVWPGCLEMMYEGSDR